MSGRIVLASCAVTFAVALAGAASAQIPNANHYLCRKVKDQKVPAKFVPQLGVTVVDQVGIDTGEAKKPFLLCNPTSKNGGVIVDPSLHYCCYKFKSSLKPAVVFDVTDQFGPLRLETKKPFLLCNPCSKAPA
jgi:hypothetical protein